MKFLLSEDNQFLRTAIKKLLQKNYPTAIIEEAKTGSELLIKALDNNSNWDLIISNISSTGLAGVEITETLRKTKHIPILILSAVKLEDYASFGFLDYIAGFVLTDNLTVRLPKAINSILSQGIYRISPTKIAC